MPIAPSPHFACPHCGGEARVRGGRHPRQAEPLRRGLEFTSSGLGRPEESVGHEAMDWRVLQWIGCSDRGGLVFRIAGDGHWRLDPLPVRRQMALWASSRLTDVSAGTGCSLWHTPWITFGPMTRRVADAAAMLEVIAGADRNDPTSLSEPVPRILDDLERGVEGLRLGFDRRYATTNVETAVAAAVEAVIDAPSRTRSRGCRGEHARNGRISKHLGHPRGSGSGPRYTVRRTLRELTSMARDSAVASVEATK